jgi:hypothetical protein
MSLLHKDYIDILNFYNIDGVNMTKKDVKLLAEDYLANKLCRCIKKVNPKKKNEKKAIKICRNSVLHKKGLDVKKFKCKKKASFISNKRTRSKLFKYNKKSKKGTRRR